MKRSIKLSFGLSPLCRVTSYLIRRQLTAGVTNYYLKTALNAVRSLTIGERN